MSMENKATDVPRFDFTVLRDLRKRNGLTISDVSQSSGVSTAVISKLERNQTSAELETIYKLARAFDLSAQDLIGLAETQFAHKITADKYSSNNFNFKTITYGNLKCFSGTATKGAKTAKPEIHQNDYEVCWVVKGAIKLTVGSEEHELKSGEAIQFDAILEHSYEAMANCEIIIIHIVKDQRF